MENITIKRLRAKAIFKIIFMGLFCAFIPFFTLMGILASQGLITMYWGAVIITGFKAIFIGPLFGILLTLVFGSIIGIFTTLGLMLYSKLKPITLEYYPQEPSQKKAD